jgi:hypothetical protein
MKQIRARLDPRPGSNFAVSRNDVEYRSAWLAQEANWEIGMTRMIVSAQKFSRPTKGARFWIYELD